MYSFSLFNYIWNRYRVCILKTCSSFNSRLFITSSHVLTLPSIHDFLCPPNNLVHYDITHKWAQVWSTISIRSYFRVSNFFLHYNIWSYLVWTPLGIACRPPQHIKKLNFQTENYTVNQWATAKHVLHVFVTLVNHYSFVLALY